MTRHEKLFEKYEDALFELLMDEVAQTEGEKALQLNEQLMMDSDAEIPISVQLHCEKTIRNAFLKQRVQSVGHTTGKVIQRVSVIVMLGVLLFTTAFAVSTDFRTYTLNTIIQVFDDRTQFTFQEKVPNDIHKNHDGERFSQYGIVLDWLPEGYEFESGKSDMSGKRISIISPKDGLIEVSITPYTSETVYSLNTEDSIQKKVEIQGHSATLYTVNDSTIQQRYVDNGMPYIWSESSVFWIDDIEQVIVRITANNMTEDEMLQLAEGICWNK